MDELSHVTQFALAITPPSWALMILSICTTIRTCRCHPDAPTTAWIQSNLWQDE
jgi:hypothetical protein